MAKHVIRIDKQGRIKLPREICEKYGLLPESDALVELRGDGIFIKPHLTEAPITQRIAEMDLPVSGWQEMEKEIEQGHLE